MVNLLTTPLPPVLYNLIAALVMLVFAFRGYKRGLLKELFAVSALLLCVPLSVPFGRAIRDVLPLEGIPRLLHQPIADAAGGLIAYCALVLLFVFIRTLIQKHWEPQGRLYTLFRIGGVSVGAAFGFLLILVAGWLILTMGAISQAAIERQSRKPDGAARQNELLMLPAKMVGAHKQALENSAIGSFAEETNPVPKTVTRGIDVATGVMKDPKKLQRLVEHRDIAHIMQQQSVQKLMQNEEIRTLARKGDIVAIMHHPAVVEMLEDPALQESLQGVHMEELLQYLEGE
jgi:uncharacterized membrane protein required for colicin V production